MRLRPLLLAIAVVTPLRAFAQTPAPAEAAPPPPPPPPPAEAVPPPPPPPPPPPADMPPAVVAAPMAPAPVAAAPGWKDLVTIEGLADAYYQYNFTGPSPSVTPVTMDASGMNLNPGQRNFDLNANTFTLNYAKVGLGVNADPVGVRLDLGYGATGLLINGANPADATSTPFLVQQAYATFAPVKGLTIDFGKFVTTAGAEVIEANKNWLYSRSIAFFNIPLLHTGFRAGYKVNDMVSLQASVINGWNGVGIAPDVTGAKTYGLSLNLTPMSGLNVVATTYIGKNEAIFPTGFSPNTRILGDLVVAYTMGPLGLNLNFDYIKDEGAGLYDVMVVSAMGRYAVSDAFALAGRGEYWTNNVPSGRQNAQEVTIGGAFPMANRLEARLEARADFREDAFLNSDGAPTSNMVTGTAALLGWF
jgi:hypothetical protein